MDAEVDFKCTFGELYAAACRAAHGLLELGVQQGDSVGFHCSNGPELVVSLCATFFAGCTAVLSKTNLTAGRLPSFHYLARKCDELRGFC